LTPSQPRHLTSSPPGEISAGFLFARLLARPPARPPALPVPHSALGPGAPAPCPLKPTALPVVRGPWSVPARGPCPPAARCPALDARCSTLDARCLGLDSRCPALAARRVVRVSRTMAGGSPGPIQAPEWLFSAIFPRFRPTGGRGGGSGLVSLK